ncbi:chymotrypsin-like protease CTRL-1 [Puntigrus tetrazona]|uniref:chymotrypsin-like protease CTRL-1 n=1 Tax=Puntigrus tetrazona TaxID=1606681 RepID=UPI001C89C3C1|nr:chymotrypsin-like protease CTRL-1 [Puntigrus tetrazona]
MKFNTAFCVAGVILLNLTGCLGQLDECGRAPLNTKIIGGQNATAGSWPWQASIHSMSRGRFCSSGSLINKDWVLTGVSCARNINMSDIVIYLGRLSQNGSNPHEISRTVTEVIKYPDTTSMEGQLSLFRLSSSVNFTDYIKPVCLAAADSVYAAGTKSWITGWGVTSYPGNTYPNILQELETTVVGNTECQTVYEGIATITDKMLCAGGEAGKAPCFGDDGSALVIKQGSVWIQIGSPLLTVACGQTGYPTVYTRLSKFRDWINNYTSTARQPELVPTIPYSPQPELVSIPYSPQPELVLMPYSPEPEMVPDPFIPSIFDKGSVNLLSFSLALTVSIVPLIFFCFF